MEDFFKIIILVGAIQGIIAGFLLFSIKNNKRSNRILAVMLWLMSLAGLNLHLEYNGWFYSSTPIAIAHALVPMVIVMPLGPLLLFYIKSSLDPSFRIGKRQKLQFLPVIIDIVPQLAAAIFLFGVLLGLLRPVQEPWTIFIDTYNVFADIPRWLSLTYYTWLSIKYIHSFQSVNQSRIKWLKTFTGIFIVFQGIWFMYLVPYVIPRYTDWVLDTFNWYPVYIPLSILIYWLGIKGYIIGITSTALDKQPRQINLSEQAIQDARKALTKAMEVDKLYINPSLTIDELAQQMNMAPKTLSAILNQYMQTGFNEFINKYRVAEVKEKLLQEEYKHLTIAGIASGCGFSSQASFQRIFKQQTGVSPSEFRKSISKAS